MTRSGVSGLCACVGVLLLLLAYFMSAQIPLFVGLALIAVSHVLTPCQDQITQWWRKRISR